MPSLTACASVNRLLNVIALVTFVTVGTASADKTEPTTGASAEARHLMGAAFIGAGLALIVAGGLIDGAVEDSPAPDVHSHKINEKPLVIAGGVLLAIGAVAEVTARDIERQSAYLGWRRSGSQPRPFLALHPQAEGIQCGIRIRF